MNLALTPAQDCLARHRVRVLGEGPRTLVFGPGFGCQQSVWEPVALALAREHRVVLFDFHLEHGACDDPSDPPYDSLWEHGTDVVEMLAALDLHDAIFVGHSVAAMIGLLAAIQAPARFERLVMLGPSARYLDEPPHYTGGFGREQVDGLLDLMDRNFLDWSQTLAPLAFGEFNDPGHALDYQARLCNQHPRALRAFLELTLLSDHRADLARCPVPVLVVQNPHDDFVPPAATRYLMDQLPDARLRLLDASGHCPHISHPCQVIRALREALQHEPRT